MFWKRKPGDPMSENRKRPDNPYFGLRRNALNCGMDMAGWKSAPSGRHVYGGVLDWGIATGTATVFALDDGTASLYLSSGGGVIGGGFHPTVSQRAKEFVLLLEQFIDQLQVDTTDEPPPAGATDIRALTDTGRLFVRAITDDLTKRTHPMTVVFDAAQALIGELRQIATSSEGRPGLA